MVLFVASCAENGSSTVVPASTIVAPATSGTRYRVGDFVVYRYSGSFSIASVTLREEVMAQQGTRVRIDVTATRGADVRRWIQVVTDTPENEKGNVVDALYEMQGEKWALLANEKNADLLRLSSWIIVEPDGRATDVASGSCREKIAGVEYDCTCTTGKNLLHAAPITFRATDCKGFLWTHGSASFRDADGKDLVKVEVVETGRNPKATPQPFTP